VESHNAAARAFAALRDIKELKSGQSTACFFIKTRLLADGICLTIVESRNPGMNNVKDSGKRRSPAHAWDRRFDD
jgi:hypothetical protein